MKDSESGTKGRCPSINNVKTASLILTGITICIIFIWGINEQKFQERIRKFTEMVGMVRPLNVQQESIRTIPPLESNKTKNQRLPWDYNWDRLHFQKSRTTGIWTVFLVRHGQYDSKTLELNERGRQQANVTGRRLREFGMKYKVIIHSTMVRARQTAEIIRSHLPEIPVVADDLLQEGAPLPPIPTITYWALPDKVYSVDGPRLESAFKKYFHRAPPHQKGQSFEILVGHGNIFRYFTLRALQLAPDAWMRLFIAHASITQINIFSDGTVTSPRLGDSGHFSTSMVTY